jgi:separase
VYRIPSISYLVEQHNKGNDCPIVNVENTKFLINSANNLPLTERIFMRIKQDYPSWTGICGRKPEFPEFYRLLGDECFLFMGHGTGSSHLREKTFHHQPLDCFMMLFGCSSVSLTEKGT